MSMLDKAINEIELRMKTKYQENTGISYNYTRPLEDGTYCLIITDKGYMYYLHSKENKVKKAIKYFSKYNPKYYFFTIYTNEYSERELIM